MPDYNAEDLSYSDLKNLFGKVKRKGSESEILEHKKAIKTANELFALVSVASENLFKELILQKEV